MSDCSFPGGETPSSVSSDYEEEPCKCGHTRSKNKDKFEEKDLVIKVGESGYIKAYRCITCKDYALLTIK